MRGLLEAFVFLGLAAGVHAAVFLGPAEEGMPPAAGDGGAGQVTLAAVSPALAAALQAWETPPEISAVAERVPAPSEDAPARPAASEDRPVLPMLAALDRPEAATSPGRAILPEAPALPPLPEAVARPRDDAAVPPPAAGERPAAPHADAALRPRSAPAQPVAPDRAAGSGGTAAGQQASAPVAGLSADRRTTLLASWGGQIRARIERKKRAPLGAGAEGQAVVRITVASDGTLNGVALLRSSGVRRLDDAAIASVRRAAPFSPAPEGLGTGAVFDLPVAFAR